MSRSHFVLAVALVVIAATMVFVKTFPDDPAPASAASDKRAKPVASAKAPSSSPERFRSAKPITPRSGGKSNFDIGFDRNTLASLTDDQRRQALGYAARAEADARDTLANLTEKYNLTRQQQRDIFPTVAAHTDSYHPSMAVNGVAVSLPAAGTSLEESIHGQLDSTQQAAVEEEMLDDIKWWQEIASQLEEDLNSATDAGEVVATADPTPVSDPVTLDTTPAEGDGEAASHSGGNIFDLLNQGN